MDWSCIEELLELPEYRVIDLKKTSKALSIDLERREQEPACPRCGSASSPGKERRSRSVRDLPILQRPLSLVLWARRLWCPGCKRRWWEKSMSLPAPKRWTERLYQTVRNEALRGSPIKELARRYGAPQRTLFRWTFERSRGGRPRKLGKAIGIDEYAREKGHRYNTLIVDLDKRKPIVTFKGRRKDDVVGWLKRRPAEELAWVEVVVIDMSKPYAAAVKELFGDSVLVIDRFHVVKNAVDALDEVLRAIRKQLDKGEKKELKKLRRRWFKADDQLEMEMWLARENWLVRFSQLREVIDWIQDLRKWFERKYTKPARKALQKLIDRAKASTVEGLKRVSGTLTRWFDPIVRYIHKPYTNGLTEGFNTKIKLIQRMAYGIRNEHNRRKRILAWCGAG